MVDEKRIENLLGHVDIEVFEAFMELLKNKYPLVDIANYFLETKAGISGVNIAMANQRDFISHLGTVLRDKTLTKEEQLQQVSAAEEHLRRAIIESYQRSVDMMIINITGLFQKYQSHVAPFIKDNSNFEGAPTIEQVKNDLSLVKNLYIEGRKSKSINKWNSEWETGVKHFIAAFSQAEELHDTIEKYLAIANTNQINKPEHKILNWKNSTIVLLIVCLMQIIIYLCK